MKTDIYIIEKTLILIYLINNKIIIIDAIPYNIEPDTLALYNNQT